MMWSPRANRYFWILLEKFQEFLILAETVQIYSPHTIDSWKFEK